MLHGSVEKILTYVQVAPFPHGSAATFGITSALTSHMAVRMLARRKAIAGTLLGCIALAALGVAIFAEADARSRFQEYKRIRALLERYGWKRRIIDPVSFSRCQRDTAQVAAIKAGYGAQIKRYFYDRGYRWYHVVPDALLKDPLYLFSRQFIRSSFFVKTYNARRRASSETRM